MSRAARGAALTPGDNFIAAFVGFGIIAAHMVLVAMQAVDLGFHPSALSAAVWPRA